MVDETAAVKGSRNGCGWWRSTALVMKVGTDRSLVFLVRRLSLMLVYEGRSKLVPESSGSCSSGGGFQCERSKEQNPSEAKRSRSIAMYTTASILPWLDLGRLFVRTVTFFRDDRRIDPVDIKTVRKKHGLSRTCRRGAEIQNGPVFNCQT